MPPWMPRSRSFRRFTTRVALPHLGQSVLLDVSITFLRSAVLAILRAMVLSCTVLSHPRSACKAAWGHRRMFGIDFGTVPRQAGGYPDAACARPGERQPDSDFT